MIKKTVWKFTNQRKLTKKEFLNYFERKVFRTIRKYKLLPKNRIIKLKKSNSLNTAVLKKVIEKKFKVKFTSKPDFSSDNLSQIAEDVFKNILQGKFNNQKPVQKPAPNTDDKLKKPLYFLSDKEIELYAKLTNIKGTKRKQNKKIQSLFEKFLKKNQDLEQNIVKAFSQLP
tara:strand:- start:1 stop:516 length:516 start_codon:yes stop_codon:yes gene_type:complete